MLGRLLDGRYQCEELLGSGGMGEVWRGRDLRLDRRVAIKVLAAAGLMEPMAAERFDREARAAAGLTHPHIVAVYDFGTEENDSYLIMELVEGRTVSALIADGPLTVLQALSIAVQACDGIAAAHTAGVVHRDVKPGNLIVNATGTVKICDFGIARLPWAEGENTLTEPATKLGTSSYMSPEQALGQPVDHRTDLYGLGCTLYAMLAGGPPFAGEPLSVLHQHVNVPPPPLRERRPDVPAELDALAAELLAKDPADRPSDAAEVRDRLAALLPRAGTPVPRVSVTPADPGGPGRSTPVTVRPPRRDAVGPARPRPAWHRRAALLAAALLGVALLALAGVTLLDRDDHTPVAGPTTPPVSATTAVAPRVPAVPLTVAPATPALGTVASATRNPASPTPSPRATSRRPTPTAPADPIAGMRQSIREQVEAGRLNPDAAKDLHSKVDAIAKEIAESDPDQAEDQLKKLREKLGDLRRDGKLTADGYDALTADADRIAADLR
ncbi:protein kinase [Micromonospora sp. DR5-3]|uniref:serine/threonine-protein kinase n=1 Tax=unclassified Micromonospora TaxID=2617518 RepID=UPI001652977C|nr:MULTISPECIES: serine/threonine-protein kinase [unclassified Micromonospora]MCW3817921.1 protein kinase [Micromonospora sp. DR5-3]